jgi:hypothetical protein
MKNSQKRLVVPLLIIIALIVVAGFIIYIHFNKPDLIIENIVTKPPGVLDVTIKNTGWKDVTIKNTGWKDVTGKVYLCLIDMGNPKNKGTNEQNLKCDHTELVNINPNGKTGDIIPINKNSTLVFSVYGYSYFGPVYAYIDRSVEKSSDNLVSESNENNNLYILK